MTSRGNGETGKLGMSSNRGRPRVVNDRCGRGGGSGSGRVKGKGGTAGVFCFTTKFVNCFNDIVARVLWHNLRVRANLAQDSFAKCPC